jgi:hypothetical protein
MVGNLMVSDHFHWVSPLERIWLRPEALLFQNPTLNPVEVAEADVVRKHLARSLSFDHTSSFRPEVSSEPVPEEDFTQPDRRRQPIPAWPRDLCISMQGALRCFGEVSGKEITLGRGGTSDTLRYSDRLNEREYPGRGKVFEVGGR